MRKEQQRKWLNRLVVFNALFMAFYRLQQGLGGLYSNAPCPWFWIVLRYAIDLLLLAVFYRIAQRWLQKADDQ